VAEPGVMRLGVRPATLIKSGPPPEKASEEQQDSASDDD